MRVSSHPLTNGQTGRLPLVKALTVNSDEWGWSDSVGWWRSRPLRPDEWCRKVTRRSSLSEPHCNLKHIDPLRAAPGSSLSTAVVPPPSPLCPQPSNRIPFVGDAAPPPQLPHLPIRDYEVMSGEDALRTIDSGEDWVESAADNSCITPGSASFPLELMRKLVN